jgi:hypothetical protein
MVALLMGGIGSGKTTFLKRFFSLVVRDLIVSGGPAILALLDFLGAPVDGPELDRFMWAKLAGVLRQQDSTLSSRTVLEELCATKLTLIMESYGPGPECDRRSSDALFALGNDPEEFSQESLKYYLRLGKMPIVVFDNVDQLGVDAQTRIFTTAERFANQLGCVSILVMREESYCVAQLRKQLTAYTIRPYHLSSPSFRDIIKVRLDFATRSAAEERDAPAQDAAAMHLSREILDFFDVLRRSVFDKNRNITRLTLI